jgi:hypothetical protein
MANRTTRPSVVEVTTADDLPLVCDFAEMLAGVETIVGVTTTLTDLATGLPVTLTAPPTYTDTSASQPIIGSDLTTGERYRLVWSVATSHGLPIAEATTISVAF